MCKDYDTSSVLVVLFLTVLVVLFLTVLVVLFSTVLVVLGQCQLYRHVHQRRIHYAAIEH